MKKRLHNKQAGIAILLVILILSLLDVIMRTTLFRDIAAGISNYGEPFATVLFSALLIGFLLKGKDRVFYILCGAWFGFFVLSQVFRLPGMLASLFTSISAAGGFGAEATTIFLHLLSMICIIAIGALLAEYLNDGTIYNKAFNFFCISAFLILFIHAVFCILVAVTTKYLPIMLALINTLTSITMIFLFTFFAYDSAKAQLEHLDK